jgi:hypothetical protein
MTEFHTYAELTWPEVRALPRSTPMVLPLGSGYSPDQLSDALGHPQDIYMLPSFPFGWMGSGLYILAPVFEQYVTNIIASLRDDGFLNCLILSPPGLDLKFPVPWIALPHKSTAKGVNPFPPMTDLDKVVLIPIGHTEQHGYHLPLSTDTLIIEAIASGTAAQAPEFATIIPVMPYGVSTHRQAFAGTVNAGGRSFEDFWVNVIDILAARGFSRFYFLNGHGWNSSYIVNVIKSAGERHRRIFCATAWLYLSGPDGWRL